MNPLKLAILSPVFNDWESAQILLQEIDRELKNVTAPVVVDLYFIDDGSTVGEHGTELNINSYQSFSQISVIELGRNLGNQRAIAVGLSHLSAMDYDSVLLMDSDGEDCPDYIPGLISEHLKTPARPLVFAKRTRRSETLSFKVGYALYKFLYEVLTGKKIFFGNYSVINMRDVKRLVLHSELWSHYPATVLKARIPWVFIDSVRAKRYKGQSKMVGWVPLVVHGLSGISAYMDDIGVRSIIGSLFTICVSIIAFLAIMYEKLFTNLAIVGWASTFGISFINITFQALIASLLLSFFILNNRTSVVHTPLHYSKQFILKITVLFKK